MAALSAEVQAPAKLNLFLRVVGRYPNGYHELFTLFHKICLSDRLWLRWAPSSSTRIALELHGPWAGECPKDPTNLAWRAASAFLEKVDAKGELSITLQKEIPVGAGLGGGSSDAGAVLRGLNHLLGHPLSQEELQRLALSLGADCPFFVRPEISALGRGIGEKLEPLEVEHRWFLLVKPHFSISTAEVYRDFQLTTPKEATIFRADSVFDPKEWRNDLEGVVFSRWSQVRAIKDALLAAGAQAALMSGSGSAFFGIFPREALATEAGKRLEKRWLTRVTESCRDRTDCCWGVVKR